MENRCPSSPSPRCENAQQQQGNTSTRSARHIGPSGDIESVLSYPAVHHGRYQKAIRFKRLGLPNLPSSQSVFGADTRRRLPLQISPVCLQCPKESLRVCHAPPNVSQLSVIVPAQRFLGRGSHGRLTLRIRDLRSSSPESSCRQMAVFPHPHRPTVSVKGGGMPCLRSLVHRAQQERAQASKGPIDLRSVDRMIDTIELPVKVDGSIDIELPQQSTLQAFSASSFG